MSEPAQLTITSGPDRGRTFELRDEVVHIGRGDENDVALSDPTLAEHQASIVSRNGRYAIFSPDENAVAVGENAIPPDQWVWLPEEARIRIGERTIVHFRSAQAMARAETPRATPVAAAVGAPAQPHEPADLGSLDPFGEEAETFENELRADEENPSSKRSRRRRRPRKRKRSEGTGEKRKVARFVTDQTGDTVVTLGEDGQLPELQLTEGRRERRKVDKAPKEGLSVGVYALLIVSLLSSVFMLFADLGPGSSTRRERAIARQDVRTFIETTRPGARPEPYQVQLRKAILAAARGDSAAEREAYREVLGMLTSEDKNPINGVTGSIERDQRLQDAIAVLLSR